MQKGFTFRFFPLCAWLVLAASAVCSVYFVLRTGRNNDSLLLNALFTIWVFSPFAGLFAAERMSVKWVSAARFTIYTLMLVLSIGAVIAYSGYWKIPGAKPAFIFLVFPLISWMLLVVAMLLLRIISKRQ